MQGSEPDEVLDGEQECCKGQHAAESRERRRCIPGSKRSKCGKVDEHECEDKREIEVCHACDQVLESIKTKCLYIR